MNFQKFTPQSSFHRCGKKIVCYCVKKALRELNICIALAHQIMDFTEFYE